MKVQFIMDYLKTLTLVSSVTTGFTIGGVCYGKIHLGDKSNNPRTSIALLEGLYGVIGASFIVISQQTISYYYAKCKKLSLV